MAKDTNTDIAIISNDDIKSKIYTIRGMQVMLDRDLASMFGTETRRLNEQVRRNIDRFPEEFCFQLNDDEFQNWKSQFATSNSDKMGLRKKPYAFTEHGVSMLPSVLKTDAAVKVSIRIIKMFVSMRRFIADNAGIFQRLDRIEMANLEFKNETEAKFNEVFKKLEVTIPGNSVIFFDGTFYDAKSFIRDLVAKPKDNIILIDDYISKVTIDILRQRRDGVKITIYTFLNSKNTDKPTEQEIKDFNRQYGGLAIKNISTFHDRFLILDNKELYSIGASLKDAGNKTFAINRMDDELILKALLGHLN